MVKFWNSCLAAAAVMAFGATSALAADVKVSGAGATFPAPLYAQWVEAYSKAHPGTTVDYQSVGSGAGIKAITDRTVSFGASDAPMNEAQEKAAPGKLLHLPMVAGPEVMIYNLTGVSKVTLNGQVVADIYNKKITKWNDPAIAALNAGVALPADVINVVHRSDGSGTTYIFTDYLSKVSKDWADNVGKGTTVDWPTGIAGKGNDGVTAAVKNTNGGLGYVEFAYADKNKIPYATLLNKDGKAVPPTVPAINAAAAASAKMMPADMKISITDAPGADSYPICGFTYVIVYEDVSYLKDKAVATAMLDYIKWCVTEGQKTAGGLGYAQLPKEMQDMVLEKLKIIKFDGQPLMK